MKGCCAGRLLRGRRDVEVTRLGHRLWLVGAVFLVLDVVLLFSGHRILWREEPTEECEVFGGLAADRICHKVLVCSYFTGRSFRETKDRDWGDGTFPDECPVLVKPV